MWNLKYDTNEAIYKTETDSQIQKINQWLPEVRGKEQGQNRGVGLRGTSYYV